MTTQNLFFVYDMWFHATGPMAEAPQRQWAVMAQNDVEAREIALADLPKDHCFFKNYTINDLVATIQSTNFIRIAQ